MATTPSGSDRETAGDATKMELLREERHLVEGHDEHLLPLSFTTGALSTEMDMEPAGDEPAQDQDEPTQDRPTEDATSVDALREEGQLTKDHDKPVLPLAPTKATENVIIKIFSGVMCNDMITSVSRSAVQDPDIGVERFSQQVQLLVVKLGKELEREAKDSKLMVVARALQSGRVLTLVARELVVRSGALFDEMNGEDQDDEYHQDEAQQDEDQQDEDQQDEDQEDQDQEDEHKDQGVQSDASLSLAATRPDNDQLTGEDTTQVKDFLVASRAYASLINGLVDFAHLPYKMRICNAVGDIAMGESGKQVHYNAINVIIDEDLLWTPADDLSWTPADLINFEDFDSYRLPFSDYLKVSLHNLSGEPIFYLRFHPLREGFSRLQWTSACGTPHHLDVPQSVTGPLLVALGTAPAFMDLASVPSAEFMEKLKTKIYGLPSSPSIDFRRYLDQLMKELRGQQLVYSTVALNMIYDLPSPARVAPVGYPALSDAEKFWRRTRQLTYSLLLHSSILMLPCIIIVLLWLLVWGDSLTLMDAWVPFFLSLAVTLLLFILADTPYSHRKVVYILGINFSCILGFLLWMFVLGHPLALKDAVVLFGFSLELTANVIAYMNRSQPPKKLKPKPEPVDSCDCDWCAYQRTRLW